MVKRFPNMTMQEKFEIIFLYKKGVSAKRIAAHYNRNNATIFRVLSEFSEKREKLPIDDLLIEFYSNAAHSEKIASEFSENIKKIGQSLLKKQK